MNIDVNVFQESSFVYNEKKAYEVFDDTIHSLRQLGYSYPRIAETMGCSEYIIKNAAYMDRKKPKHKKMSQGHPGRREIDWSTMDNELLPKAAELLLEWKDSAVPKRITINAVSQKLGLKSKQIYNLPQCLSEIKKSCQSQEEFWAEKVSWAWGILLRENTNLSIKKLRLKTNMSTEQIRRCLPELENYNSSVYRSIVALL